MMMRMLLLSTIALDDRGYMMCPYCSEEIKDEALVCRFCNHDLFFLRPLITRLKAIDESIATLDDRISRLQAQVAHVSASAVNLSTRKTPEKASAGPWAARLSVGALFTCLVSGVAAWLASNHYVSSFQYLVAAFASAWPVGIYLAFRMRDRRIWTYALQGAFYGALIPAVVSAVYKDWPPALLLAGMCIGSGGISAMFFASSAWVGRWLRSKGSFERASVSARVAYNLIGRPALENVSGGTEERWKRVASTTAALGPILSLVGTIVAAYFGYLGAAIKVGAAASK